MNIPLSLSLLFMLKKHHPTFQARKNLRRDRATEVVYI